MPRRRAARLPPRGRAAPHRADAESGDDAGNDLAVPVATDQDPDGAQLVGDSNQSYLTVVPEGEDDLVAFSKLFQVRRQIELHAPALDQYGEDEATEDVNGEPLEKAPLPLLASGSLAAICTAHGCHSNVGGVARSRLD